MKRSELIFSALLVPLDFLALLAAAIVAYQIRFLPSVTQIRPVIFSLTFATFWLSAAVASAVGVGMYALSGLYRISPNRGIGDEFTKLVMASSTTVALAVGWMFFTRYLFESRFIILTAWLLSILFSTTGRIMLRTIRQQLYRVGIGTHRLALVGNGPVADELQREFARRPTLGYRVVAQFGTFTPAVAAELTELARNDRIDEVVQTGSSLTQPQTLELVTVLQEHHLDYTYTADLLGAKVANFQVVIHAGIPMVEVKRTRLDGWGKIWKRCFDLVGACVLLLVTLPVLAATAVAIVVDSGRPVFFTYRRVGERGKPFTFIKFRSMVPGMHRLRYDAAFARQHPNLRAGSPMVKFRDDPRVTRVGRLLRRWSIDELPQLALVIIGTMSLVGPRPHEIEEVARYHLPQRRVLAIKPGITGLAQVSGRSDLDFDEEIKLDTYYLQNWSPWLDLQILLKTPAAVVRRRQAE